MLICQKEQIRQFRTIFRNLDIYQFFNIYLKILKTIYYFIISQYLLASYYGNGNYFNHLLVSLMFIELFYS